MQVLITQGHPAKTRVLHCSRLLGGVAALLVMVLLTLVSGTAYHFVHLKAARDAWPVASQLVHWVAENEIAHRDRFMRANLDAMADEVGEMQAKLVKRGSVNEHVSGLAGTRTNALKALQRASGRQGRPRPCRSSDAHSRC